MPGKRTVVELYDIKLTPETIAYAAIMSWAVQDGSFQADVFYHNIVDLFEDKDWADETMAWWNKWNNAGHDNTHWPKQMQHAKKKARTAKDVTQRGIWKDNRIQDSQYKWQIL
ncbi:hypothetical protein BC826DRAFT_976082 [Russula brevipes]|nr:hypothetical protein BC826DRAFT_976082 [Russula brevipes]